MQKQDYEDLELNKSLVKQLQTLIDGNQISGDALVEKSHKIYECEVKLALTWRFDASYRGRELVGGSPASVHFGDNQARFEQHTEGLKKQAQTDTKLRMPFLGAFVEAGHEGLLEVAGEVVIKTFDEFSYSYKCRTCGGRGYESCRNCSGGKVSCSQCSGNGYTERYQERYDYKGEYQGRWAVRDTCYHCGGSGKRTCSNCGGKGRVRCSTCYEKGFFTEYRTVSAVAVPSFSVQIHSNAYDERLGDFLNSGAVSLHFIASRVRFEFLSHESEGADRERFFYKAQSLITQLNFELLGKEHSCLGFSNPPYPFVRPSIFDDIFADELALIDKINKDGKITQREAFGFFSKYQGQPVLDLAMINIAKTRENSDDDASGIVSNACQHFVSKATAQKLGAFLSKCIDKISPAYSKFTWILGTLLFCVFALASTELHFEEKFKDSIFWTSLTAVLGVGFLWLLWGGLLWGVSSLVTLFRRRKVPKEYRQKMRNHEARARGSLAVLLVFLVGAVYGGLASKGVAYKFGAHYSSAKTALCATLKGYEWDKKLQISAALCPTKKGKKSSKSATKSASGVAKSTNSAAKSSGGTNFKGTANSSANSAGNAAKSSTAKGANSGGTNFKGTASGVARSSGGGGVAKSSNSAGGVAKTNKDKVADSVKQRVQ